MSDKELVLTDVEFGFGDGPRTLGPISLRIAAGARTALIGPSGSGKSTLLQLMAGVLRPRSGEVRFGEVSLGRLDQDGRARVRLADFGMVFQFAELVPELTLAENVELPLRILGRRDPDRVRETLTSVGIAHLADRLPSRVSGGERQRAAIARAIVHRPAVVLADEPTGALDQANGRMITELLLEAADEARAALVIVTHDHAIASRLPTVIQLEDGLVTA